MKQENQKSKKWLLPVVIAAMLLLVAGVVLALVFGVGGGAGDQPTDPAQVTSKLYWNVDRLQYLDKESGFSNREPGEDGMYHIRFAVDGEQVEYAVADKKLVNYIDAVDVVGLSFDTDGMNFTRHYVMEDGTVSGSNFGNFSLIPVSHQHENDPVMQVALKNK